MNDSLDIRDAKSSDYIHFKRLFDYLELDHEPPPKKKWQKDFASKTLFAVLDHRIVGFSTYNKYGKVGHLVFLSVAPKYRQRGIGEKLVSMSAGELSGQDCDKWYLNVKPQNKPAIGLYSKMGFSVKHRSTAIRFDNKILDNLRNTEDCCVVTIDPHEYSEIEKELGLVEGMLDTYSKYVDRQMVRLKINSNPKDYKTGFMCFDPSFPGAYPFKVSSVKFAIPLIVWMKSQVLHDVPYIQIFIEDNEELTSLLLNAGAWSDLQLLNMEVNLL